MKTGSTSAKRQLKENEGELKVSEVKTATASTCPDNVSPNPESIDMGETSIAAEGERWAKECERARGNPHWHDLRDAYQAGHRETFTRIMGALADSTWLSDKVFKLLEDDIKARLSGDTLPTPPADNDSGGKR